MCYLQCDHRTYLSKYEKSDTILGHFLPLMQVQWNSTSENAHCLPEKHLV